MSENTQPVITLQETQTHEVAADRADLFVTVEGASLFSGTEALKKAREVALLVSDLTAFGLPPDAIFLQGVSADVHSGTLTKNSRVKYRLRVHCADLSKLADLVGIVTAQKNTSLTSIDWGYPDTDAAHDDWLLACIARVNEKADKIAAALGVRILGVASFSETLMDPEARHHQIPTLGGSPGMVRRERMSGEDLGLEVSHAKTLYAAVQVNYLVSGREAAGAFSQAPA